MPCSLLEVNQHFKGTCHLHLQVQRISQARNQPEAGSKHCFMLVSCLAYSSILKMEVICSSEVLTDFQQTTEYSHKRELFITIAVRMSNPTK
jgi:hypothetical protein